MTLYTMTFVWCFPLKYNDKISDENKGKMDKVDMEQAKYFVV